MVKNLLAIRENLILSLGWEDPLEDDNPLQHSCLENPHGQRSLGTIVHGVARSQTGLNN